MRRRTSPIDPTEAQGEEVDMPGVDLESGQEIDLRSAAPEAEAGFAAELETSGDLFEGGVSDAVVTPTATAIVRVAEKVSVTDAEIEQGRDTLRDEMVNARRDRFFGAYMEKAKKNLKITTRDDVLARVIGS